MILDDILYVYCAAPILSSDDALLSFLKYLSRNDVIMGMGWSKGSNHLSSYASVNLLSLLLVYSELK